MDTKDFAAGRKITCPALLLWGATGAVGRNHKPAEVWKDYATDIRGAKALPCGHYLSEEAPEETYARAARVLLGRAINHDAWRHSVTRRATRRDHGRSPMGRVRERTVRTRRRAACSGARWRGAA